MTNQAELIDVDHYAFLMDESVMVEMLQEGELNIHFIKHPERGFLTAIQAGNAVLIVSGEYVDLRERALRVSA